MAEYATPERHHHGSAKHSSDIYYVPDSTLGAEGYGCPYRMWSLLERASYEHKEHGHQAWTNQNLFGVCAPFALVGARG